VAGVSQNVVRLYEHAAILSGAVILRFPRLLKIGPLFAFSPRLISWDGGMFGVVLHVKQGVTILSRSRGRCAPVQITQAVFVSTAAESTSARRPSASA